MTGPGETRDRLQVIGSPAFADDDNQENQSLGNETLGNNSRAMAVTSYARRPALSPPPIQAVEQVAPAASSLRSRGYSAYLNCGHAQLLPRSIAVTLKAAQSTRSGHLVKAAQGTDAARLDTAFAAITPANDSWQPVPIRLPLKSLKRSVAQLARAPVSKTGGWGFESLHSCQRMAK
jgi:hypothetical protein